MKNEKRKSGCGQHTAESVKHARTPQSYMAGMGAISLTSIFPLLAICGQSLDRAIALSRSAALMSI